MITEDIFEKIAWQTAEKHKLVLKKIMTHDVIRIYFFDQLTDFKRLNKLLYNRNL